MGCVVWGAGSCLGCIGSLASRDSNLNPDPNPYKEEVRNIGEVELQEFPSVLRSERLPPPQKELLDQQIRQQGGEVELQDLTEPPPSLPSQDTEQEILNEALNKITEKQKQLTLKEFNSVVKTLSISDNIHDCLQKHDLNDLQILFS